MRLLILVFRDTVAETVAEELRVTARKICLPANLKEIWRFVADTDFGQYDYVLALGAYSGRDQAAIRIETTCTSQFRNDKHNLHQRSIPYFLMPEPPFKLSDGIGNSWCNLLCYLIVSRSLHPKVTFLHVPNRFDVERAAKAVDTQLHLL